MLWMAHMFHINHGGHNIQDEAGFFKTNMMCSLFQLSHICICKMQLNMTNILSKHLELFYLVTLLNEKHSNQKCLQYLPPVIFCITDYVLEHEFCNQQWNMYWK